MPRRSPPGNRDAIEAMLTIEELGVLHAMCAAFDVKLSRWHEQPMLRAPWEVLAARRLAERIREERGMGDDRAQMAAASMLGLNPETIRSRWKRAG